MLTITLTAPLALLVLSAPSAQEWEILHDMVPHEGYSTSAVILGDLDGDGDLDGVVDNQFGAFVYRNDGHAVFDAESLGFSGAGMDVGDVDGDADLDIFLSGSTGELLANDGGGHFTPVPGALPTSTVLGSLVVLHDMFGDGDLDAVLTKTTNLLTLFVNDGTGVYSEQSEAFPIIPLTDFFQTVAPGDLDGDGDADLYLADNDDFDYVLLGDGAGAFTVAPAAALPSILDDSRDAAVADMDLDGDLDVLVAGWENDRVLLNDGAANFVDSPSFSVPFAPTNAVAAADVDLDGDMDVLWAATAKTLYLNDGSGRLVDASDQLPDDAGSARSVDFGDLDGDGDVDALVGNVAADTLYLNDGTTCFEREAPGVPEIASDRAASLGDLDLDGDVDALVVGAGANVLDNDGTGFLRHSASGTLELAEAASALALGDLDGDVDLDAWVGTAGFCEPLDIVLVNDGDGVFAPAVGALPPVSSATLDVALADVDGDGDLDSATASSLTCVGGSRINRLYLNDGAGSFSEASAALPPHLDDSSSLLAADLDGDGDLELFVGNGNANSGAGPQQNRLYRNDGSGLFSDATAILPAVVDNTVALACGDIDADGDLDVLVGNGGFVAGTDQVRLLRNDGSGFADASAALPSAIASTRAMLLADLDEDGAVDVYLGNGIDDEIWLNDGTGTFTQLLVLPSGSTTLRDAAACDLDFDGDVELLLFGDERLFVNVARQLAWRGIPRLGKPLDLDVYGPPAGTFALLVSLGTASVPLGDPGVLLLDPLGLQVVAAGALDGGGQALASFPFPANPAFLGLDLFWQALVVEPDLSSWRLTNRERTTATDL